LERSRLEADCSNSMMMAMMMMMMTVKVMTG
jgi:hypothetical protein